MKSSLECIPCFVRQTLDACRMVTDDETKIMKIMKQVLSVLPASDLAVPPPLIAQAIHRIIRKELAVGDPYRHLKDLSIGKALEFAGTAERLITGAKDPFASSLRFAIAGNIIDFGKDTQWDEKKILGSFYKALDQSVDETMIAELRVKLEKAKTVLVLGDNAGETVFDRLFIEQFPGNPSVFYAVKGSVVLNDATAEDAVASGLDRVAHIVSNGTDIPGTIVEDSTPEFRKLFAESDVVIAKGQGNFETLNDESREIFFLLQIKCESLAKRNGYSLGDWVITSTTKIAQNDVKR